MLILEEKEFLAFRFVTNDLDPEEKFNAFNLIANDKEFRELVVLEKKLYKKMQSYKNDIPKDICKSIYKNIINEVQQEKSVAFEVSNVVIEKLLPKGLWKFINYISEGRNIYEYAK